MSAFKDHHYYNPYLKNVKKGFIHFLLWQCGYNNDPAALVPLPFDFSYPNPQTLPSVTAPQVTWVNHSTFLVKVGQEVFLTDPIWSKRCSPLPFLGPKRHHPTPFAVDEIRTLSTVLISHDHYDHLDRETVKELLACYPHLRWVVPLGVKKWFQHHFPTIAPDKLIELDWWESIYLNKETRITAVPAQHFSGRGFFDRNKTLWLGYVIETTNSDEEKRFYFAGDTGYNSHDFKEIGRHFGPLDLSLLPIGSYVPRRFMQFVHVHPAESVNIHRDVRSRLSVGGHWGTFRLAEEPINYPPYDLYIALQKEGLSCEMFRVLQPGQTINW